MNKKQKENRKLAEKILKLQDEVNNLTHACYKLKRNEIYKFPHITDFLERKIKKIDNEIELLDKQFKKQAGEFRWVKGLW